ncbi:hypothetical protein VNO78_26043 [Psophocarpus tetragonolobus]|uniref:Uncharacterized protein n=1 Tax=Psophocarpus tetragonolobus TaxID=3891 RepID=A0AAN9RZX8_PSOTE
MRLFHLLFLLLLLRCFPAPLVRAQSSQASSLDAILQEYAFRALVKPKTGTIYNATSQLPSNLTGVKIAALRLRSGSMRRKGFPSYNEFEIPKGVIVKPYLKRLVLVYQNLGNLSNTYYPLLPNYTYLAPVLGLLLYNASNLSATNLPTLNVNASGDPIKVRFQDVTDPPLGAVAKCVWFDLQGSSNFSNVTGGNTCSTSTQGHFSIVYDSSVLLRPPPPPPTSPAPSPPKESNKVGLIVGSVLGGLVFLVLLFLLLFWVLKFKQKKKIQRMERASEAGEALHMAFVRDTKAPAATGTRTQPALEHEYAP